MHLRHRHAPARERERRLAEARPGEPSEPLPELAEGGRQAGNGARGGPDRVHDGLVSERDLELDEIALS